MHLTLGWDTGDTHMGRTRLWLQHQEKGGLDGRQRSHLHKGETVMMLGIFNPRTKRDTEVFKRAITKTGQVSIAIRKPQRRLWLDICPGEITEQIRQELEPLVSIDKHYVVGVVPQYC